MASAPGYLGAEFLLKLANTGTPAGFTVVGGLRATDCDIKPAFYDVTTKDGARWKKQIEGGIQSMTISGGGVWMNETVQKAALAACVAGTISSWQLEDASGNTWEGMFACTGYKMTGGHDGVQEFSLTLESADEIEFTPATA
jgi:TP901-1 family phage major tail protein